VSCYSAWVDPARTGAVLQRRRGPARGAPQARRGATADAGAACTQPGRLYELPGTPLEGRGACAQRCRPRLCPLPAHQADA
jgi:hypothetical protein